MSWWLLLSNLHSVTFWINIVRFITYYNHQLTKHNSFHFEHCSNGFLRILCSDVKSGSKTFTSQEHWSVTKQESPEIITCKSCSETMILGPETVLISGWMILQPNPSEFSDVFPSRSTITGWLRNMSGFYPY